MPVTLSFTHTLNVSIQPGDTIYYSRIDKTALASSHNPNLGGGQAGTNLQSALPTKPVKFGIVMSVDHNAMVIVVNNITGVPIPIPKNFSGIAPYIFFSKDRRVNHSGIIGYFMETKYKNDSTMPAEIFATAVDYVESSK